MMYPLKSHNLKTIFLDNLASLIDSYDLFLVDLWGVTHNGDTPFEGALRFLNTCRASNKKVVFLSNAPRLPEASVKRLSSMGIAPELYDGIYTSGFDCFLHLKNRPNHFYQSLGTKVYHYGPDRDRSLIERIADSYTAVSSYQEADFILISGLMRWDETLDETSEMRQYALSNNIPMISANADYTVLKGDDEVLCAGAVAQAYQNAGGSVFIHGKPDPEVYSAAHKIAGDIPKNKVLMIGDSLRTDIAGAQAYGINSLMVLTGIFKSQLGHLWNHRAEGVQILDELCQQYGTSPTYLSQALDSTS